MTWLFQPLFNLLARSTDSDLAKQVEFLKAENTMLRKRLGKCVRLDAEEKSLLMRLGEAIGAGVSALLTIVSFATFQKWVKATKPASEQPKGKGGLPKTSDEIKELVLHLARVKS